MPDPTEDIEAIKRLAQAWRSGWLTGDADLLLSLYADDPVLMPQGQPEVVGKEAIRPLYEVVLKEYDFMSESVLQDVAASGDLGYFRVTYTLRATPKAGDESFEQDGKSLFIVKRQAGGAWKITCLMDNSSQPESQ